MICWSCQRDAGAGAFCRACSAIQPPDRGADHFAVLGIERRFDLDLADAERRYKELSRQLHPDRFARADAQARRASLARSVQLNDAWKTLRDPVRRAEYMLAQSGIEVGGEEGTRRTGANGEKERVPVPQELLMAILELREALMDARAEGDHGRVEALATDVRTSKERAMADVARALGSTPAALDEAAAALVSVRYYDRFLEEVAVHDEARAAAGEARRGG
jgi:molecular chaperone HscB